MEPWSDLPRKEEKRGEIAMKKIAMILAASLLWVLPASADEVVRSFRQQIPIANAHQMEGSGSIPRPSHLW